MATVASASAAAPPSPAPNDAVLIQRTRNGDGTAFDELVTRYMRQAFSVAFRILGQREDSEDLVQESFMAVLKKLDSYDSSWPFAPWFFRIVVNRALSERKSRARRQTEEIPENAVTTNPSPARSAEERELRERVTAALATLPPKDKVMIELFEFEGFNSNEIGEILGVAPGTVRWQLHQTRKKLRAALAACQESVR